MIYAPLSYTNRSKDMPLAVNAILSADGQCLSGNMVNGVYGVDVTAGVATDSVVGFLMAQTSAVPFLPSTAVKVETLVADGTGKVVLAATPVTGTVGEFDITANAAVAAPTVVGNTVTDASTASHVVRVIYTIALTVNQAKSIAGDVQPGGYSGNVVGTVAVAQQGVIYTDQFDTAVDWSDVTNVPTTGANGKIVAGGTGVGLNAKVIALPTTDIPFLGLQYDTL